jgi:hypothetical protein
VAQINQGGTGQTTRVAALNALLPDQAGSTQYMLLTDGSGTVSWGAQPVAGLPSQTSNSGRLLTTNGSTASWSNAVTVSGSNATVGGTLTVSGASVNSSGTNSVVKSTDGAVVTKVQSVLGSTLGIVGTESNHDLGVYTNNTNRLNISAAGVVSISGTTASTTTSSGALVVGNGTSGGLGVGGAITAGGTLRVIGSSQIIRVRHDASNIEFTNTAQDAYVTGTVIANTLQLHGNNGTGLTIGSTGNATFGGNLTASGTGSHVFGTTNTVTLSSGAVTANGIISTTAAAQRVINTNGAFQIYKDATPTGAARFSYNTAAADTISLGVYDGSSWTDTFRVTTTQALVTTSTASNNTSSGALVVSGGVGVAGSQYLGIKLNISTHDSSAGGIGFGTETNLYRYQAGGLALDHASGAAPGLLFRENGTSTLRLETNSGVGYLSTLTAANLILRTNATTALTLDTSQNAFFAGTIRTAAPSGGTAASWKLGSVATVSPTSPNRTIEVDIGGTIYYIHAKTTNN